MYHYRVVFVSMCTNGWSISWSVIISIASSGRFGAVQEFRRDGTIDRDRSISLGHQLQIQLVKTIYRLFQLYPIYCRYFDELRTSNASHFVSLRAATDQNPVLEASSADSALDLVEKGGYIFPVQEDSMAMQAAMKRCNLVQISKGKRFTFSYR